ncbi:MAG: 4Fe-4S dicluster domain-containing protein [Myxococcales bacterium]|nr:4Fe-4S dicluster domain-containing protein [Myxococcales bacterium]MCB9733717.1 4Fe-4S dicluster domain-containing protein [Deltaproteobacteria bacterium]
MIGDGKDSTNQRENTFVADGTTVGFLTDVTLCIGCKACEVACKEWNGVPDDGYVFTGQSYDNTGALSGSTWRHVQFHELDAPAGREGGGAAPPDDLGWLFYSDVCKHCERAGCLEACPTGAIVRTETGGVFVQDDVCNGCGYCVVGCPFGVIGRRDADLPGGGGAYKCTFCYDRQKGGGGPACAKACPTESIRFGPLDLLRAEADRRVDTLHARGVTGATLYDPRDTSVGGVHALSILVGDPERYGLPRAPEVPSTRLLRSWLSAGLTTAAMLAITALAFALAAR